VDVIVIIGIVVFLLLVFWPALLPSHEEARRSNCRANLKDIGKAVATYREDNDGYFPFSWQRAGEPEPAGNGAANAAMAATSLGNLYPHYVQDGKWFRCPSTEDTPSFVLNLPLPYRVAGQAGTFVGALPHGSNWTLTSNLPVSFESAVIRASSYGYDPRISPRAAGKLVVAADMDGSWHESADTSNQNHAGGQNVLFVDGNVRWIQGENHSANFCSNDPNDNIFSEDKWDADTDSYLVDTDAGLSVSFDGYEHLHYPGKAQPATR
jgi:prepilin-type processing-associated H-X9-DG protein